MTGVTSRTPADKFEVHGFVLGLNIILRKSKLGNTLNYLEYLRHEKSNHCSRLIPFPYRHNETPCI